MILCSASTILTTLKYQGEPIAAMFFMSIAFTKLPFTVDNIAIIIMP